MKKISGLLILILSVNLASGQEEYIPEEEDWFFYDFSHIRFMNEHAELENSIWSNSHSFSLMDDVIFGNSRFGFAYGIGYTSSNFKNNMRITLSESTGNARFQMMPESVDYDENKLNVKYVELPLELRFRSTPNAKGNFFRFYVGAKFGVRFAAYAHFREGDYEVSYHHPDELNRWKFGTYTRIGFGHVSLYAYYGLTNVFDYNFDPVIHFNDVNGMYPLAVGVSVSL